jgi:sphingosine kinase
MTTTGTAQTRSIPYYNILWAEIAQLSITIHYAKAVKSTVNVAYLHYTFESASDSAIKWVERLMSRAYPGTTQRQKRIKLLINPFGGTGRAAKLYTSRIEPILAAARCSVDVERTAYSGHAVDIASKLDLDTYDVLACCSGDGLPHECFNGLAQHSDPHALQKIAVTQLPCGSGNAFCWNFNGTGDPAIAALAVVKGQRAPFDLASVTQGDKRTLSFLSQSIGIVAESDLGTDNIRWMGEARFTYGFLVRLLTKKRYPCDIAVKEEIVDKVAIKHHFAEQAKHKLDPDWEQTRTKGLPPLKYGTIQSELPTSEQGWTPLQTYPTLGNFYSGNMCWMAGDAPFFPASLPSDGLLDLVTIDGGISRAKQINMLLAVPKNTFFDMPEVEVRKVSAVRVIPKYGKFAEGARPGKDGSEEAYFSVCGEKFPFEPFQIEIHQGIGTVLAKRPGLYEGPGPAGWEKLLRDDAEGGSESEGA